MRYRRNLGPRLTCAYADTRKGHADCAARERQVASQQRQGPRRVAWIVLGNLLLVGLLCYMAGCNRRAHAGVHYADPGPAGSALSTFTKNVFMMISPTDLQEKVLDRSVWNKLLTASASSSLMYLKMRH